MSSLHNSAINIDLNQDSIDFGTIQVLDVITG